MEDTPATGREGDRPATAESAFRAGHLTIDDHGTRHLSKSDTVTVAATEGCVPKLVEARGLVETFQAMLRQKLVADLDPWIARASVSLIGSFANGIIKDKEAVRAAVTEPRSNG